MEKTPKSTATVLAIGGLDPSGGAGLLIDNLATSATGCHFAAICSTVTIQNGLVFEKSLPQAPGDILAAMSLIDDAQQIRCIKTGALGTTEIVEAIVKITGQFPQMPLVVDPVIQSTTGGDLVSKTAKQLVKTQLLPRATLITPNLHEAQFLSDLPVNTVEEMEIAAQTIIARGANAVLIKGGHLEHGDIIDVFSQKNKKPIRLVNQRLQIGEVRGTGCALASLTAGYIALGESIENGVKRAREKLLQAMKHSKSLGKGPNILRF